MTAAGEAKARALQEIRRLEASYQGRIGAFAIDTGTGETIGHRAYERFPSRSTFKAILCGAILHKARTTDPGLMERTLRWSRDEVVAPSPITGTEENVENGLTVAQLCHAAITVSDNTAANVLLEQIGGPAGMTRYYRGLGDPVGRLDRWEPELNDWEPGEKRDTVMPAFMARDLRALTVGSALTAPDRARLNDWLKASITGFERIRAGLPRTGRSVTRPEAVPGRMRPAATSRSRGRRPGPRSSSPSTPTGTIPAPRSTTASSRRPRPCSRGLWERRAEGARMTTREMPPEDSRSASLRGTQGRVTRQRRPMGLLSIGILVALVAFGGAGCESGPERRGLAGGPATPRAAPVVRDDLQDVFRRAGVSGGFALLDVERDQRTVVDRRRAEQRRLPASTFKIPHSLIALETGVVRDENEVIPYGGRPQRLEQWERDMSMRDAIKISNVAVYETLARRIGLQREKQWLDRLAYGDREVGTETRPFWLHGPLEISATEQAAFLARLARGALPASAGHQRTVRDLVKMEERNGYALFGKTGWADGPTPDIGWWTGWVERDGHVYSFALTIDIVEDADAGKRIPIARELLTRLGVLPEA
ncbi:class D beta-lactamase [Spirillospora sp. NPDC029432]|uniref:class D beta-lactamase n=1 Tax=Spirillospora sp. NPDC029432 TaxID=3154599 RepID=UPI0034538D60